MKKIIYYSLLWVLLLPSLSSCSDMNELHQPFLDKGEHIYAAKINNVVIRPGYKRLQLDLFYSAQRINKCVIYWNIRQDSLVQDLPDSGKDGVSIILNDLAESAYSFEIVTMDKFGNRSLPVEANGRVYGDDYIGSLFNIKIDAIKVLNNKATISWKNIEFASEIEFTYETKDRGKKTIVLPIVLDMKTIFDDYLPGGEYRYRTRFKPSEIAIDLFTTKVFETGTFPE